METIVTKPELGGENHFEIHNQIYDFMMETKNNYQGLHNTLTKLTKEFEEIKLLFPTFIEKSNQSIIASSDTNHLLKETIKEFEKKLSIISQKQEFSNYSIEISDLIHTKDTVICNILEYEVPQSGRYIVIVKEKESKTYNVESYLIEKIEIKDYKGGEIIPINVYLNKGTLDFICNVTISQIG